MHFFKKKKDAWFFMGSVEGWNFHVRVLRAQRDLWTAPKADFSTHEATKVWKNKVALMEDFRGS